MAVGSQDQTTSSIISSSPKGSRIAVVPTTIAIPGDVALPPVAINSVDSGALLSPEKQNEIDDARGMEAAYTPKTPDSTDLMYPTNIGQTGRYPHFVLFHINANSKSKIITDGKKEITYTDLTEKRTSSGITTSTGNITNGLIDTVDAALTYNPITAPIKLVSNLLGIGKSDLFTASYKRLKQSIALPMPMNVSANYGTEYGQISTGGILGSFFNSLETNGLADALNGAMADALVQAPSAALSVGSVYAGAALGGNTGANMGKQFADKAKPIIQKMSGYATNERLEQLFKQVKFRDFTFHYVLAPRDEAESVAIKKIIDKFKYHMMPEVTTGHNMFFVMPDEFDIEMRFLIPDGNKSEENKFIHKIMTCALVDVSVNYSPNHQWNTFKNGAPPMIELTLSFRELEPLVRSMVDSAGFGA